MSENKNVISIIQEKYHDLSKKQKIIGEFVINNYDKAAFMTAAKLGESIGVSESTVVRFASEIGFAGYPELQRALQEVIKNKLTSVQRIGLADEYDSQNTLRGVLKSDIENIKETLDTIDIKAFNEVVEKIVKAKRIYIVGLRSSKALAEFLGFYLNLILDNVSVLGYGVSDVLEELLGVQEEELVIGIGFPRYATATVEALEYAKQKGANVVALTDSSMSPLALTAECSLIAQGKMESFVDSIVAPLSVINALVIAVGIKERTKVEETFEELEKIWKRHDIYEYEQ